MFDVEVFKRIKIINFPLLVIRKDKNNWKHTIKKLRQKKLFLAGGGKNMVGDSPEVPRHSVFVCQ